MLNCENCTMEIIGITCADINCLPICFECWLSSKDSPDGTMTCPKCYGFGQVTQYYKPENEGCPVCKGNGRIKAAETETFVKPLMTETVSIVTEDLPF